MIKKIDLIFTGDENSEKAWHLKVCPSVKKWMVLNAFNEKNYKNTNA